MHFNKMKRWGAVILAGAMAFSLMGCGSQNSDEQDKVEPTEASTEDTTEETDADTEDYVDADAALPSDFGDMIYPLTALMVESYSKELPYYNEDSTEDEADSFWFSMAVLASLMNDYVKDVTVDTDEDYLYLEEDTVDMYASAMYDAYAQGNLEFPELPADDTYAVYNEEDGTYGFLSGGIGSLKAYITDCQPEGDEYVLKAELRDADADDEVCGSYEITLVPTSYDGEDNAFAYAVSAFEEADDDDGGVDFSERDTEEFEGTTEDETTSETTDETDETDETTEEDEESSSVDNEEDTISEDDALDLAKDYYGDDAEYSFKKIVTIGDYEYYDFSVEGDSVSSTDVLVSTDGENVLGGVQNDDGTWSFDQ